MSPAELQRKLKAGEKFLLLDVRTPEEFSIAALPGAMLVPLQEITQRVSEIEAWKSATVVVYCHHGMRSARAAGFLQSLGFGEVHNLDGGIDRWSLEADPKTPRY